GAARCFERWSVRSNGTRAMLPGAGRAEQRNAPRSERAALGTRRARNARGADRPLRGTVVLSV
ncbi:MAG TPA: hypothetical protein VFQ35_08300, partial [Polyangiaceae bacterium]|nr:hypothetical protein [Polyangiaceae bacterium]